MEARYYRDLIVRAVLGPDAVAEIADDAMLAALAEQLRESEEGLSILRAKGYGLHGMGIAATAKLVLRK
jgi:hypothetical protein